MAYFRERGDEHGESVVVGGRVGLWDVELVRIRRVLIDKRGSLGWGTLLARLMRNAEQTSELHRIGL